MKKIIWLASYPKSGSTWVRMFIAAYLSTQTRALDLNSVQLITKSDSSPIYYSAISRQKISTMSQQRIDELRRDVQRCLSIELTLRMKKKLIKTHNTRIHPANDNPLIWPEFTKMAIYIVRNPLDIVDSMADHTNQTHQQVVAMMNDQDHQMNDGEKSIHHHIGTWSFHVDSWINCREFPVLVLRYEDLLTAPDDSFTKMINFLGWKYNQVRLKQALEYSKFQHLHDLEQQQTFNELSPLSRCGRFFRRGQAGVWKRVLSKDLQKSTLKNHGKWMRRLGYLDTQRDSNKR